MKQAEDTKTVDMFEETKMPMCITTFKKRRSQND